MIKCCGCWFNWLSGELFFVFELFCNCVRKVGVGMLIDVEMFYLVLVSVVVEMMYGLDYVDVV